MNDAYNPDDVTTMTGEGVRWTEPITPVEWISVLEKMEAIMRQHPTYFVGL